MAIGEPIPIPDHPLVIRAADHEVMRQIIERVQFLDQSVSQVGLETAKRMQAENVHQDMLSRHERERQMWIDAARGYREAVSDATRKQVDAITREAEVRFAELRRAVAAEADSQAESQQRETSRLAPHFMLKRQVD